MKRFLTVSVAPVPGNSQALLTATSRINIDFSSFPNGGQLSVLSPPPTLSQFALVGGSRTILSASYPGSQTVRLQLSAGTNPTAVTYTPGGFGRGLSLWGWQFGNATTPGTDSPVLGFTRNLIII